MRFFQRNVYKNQKALKIFIALTIILIIVAYNLVDYLIFNKSLNNLFFDLFASVLISGILLFIIFRAFNYQQKQLEDQVEQLTEAYQYIGKINRKIDSLIELDISTLDRSKDSPLKESAENIFRQLRTLINAHAGLLFIKKPFNYKIFEHTPTAQDTKTILDRLASKELKLLKYSQKPEFKKRFIDLGVDETFFKKYELLSKPVYMHNQDIGLMLFVFKKGTPLEDRDINIIRVFSFYLALTVTFKPDFSLYEA